MVSDIKIENVVASATLNTRIPLDKVVARIPGTEYEPEQFPGLVYRIKDPKVAFLLFGSGKIVCTGGRSVKDVKRAIKKLEDELKELGAI